MTKTAEQQTLEAVESMTALLENCQTASLATLGPEGDPLVSYSPTAVDEQRNFYLFLSELSEHTGNLQQNDRISLMVIEDEAQARRIFARNRLTVKGRAISIPPDHAEWAKAAEVYGARFGKFFDQLTRLPDFHMFKVVPQSARLVVGFGAAYDVSVNNWKSLRLLTGK